MNLEPFISALPLDTQTDFETAIFASIITLTPGTLSVDIGHKIDENGLKGQPVLFIHGLDHRLRKNSKRIKERIETPLLQITGTKPL